MRKRPCIVAEEPPDDDDDEAKLVTCRGTRVYFYCDVSKHSVLKLIEKLDEASKNALAAAHPLEEPRVFLYIHSDGGEAYAGLSAMSHIRMCKPRVVTVADGFVASAATLLFLSADERYVIPHAHVLIHQLRTTFWGKFDELLDEVSNSKMLMDTIMGIYRSRTRLGNKKIAMLLRKELNMSAEQCVEHGLAGGVL